MNETSMVTMPNARESSGRSAGGQVPRVDVLEDDHARIAAQLPIELAVPDVERDHPARAAL